MPSNEELRNLIEATLLNDSRLSAQPIQVTVRGGQVTLEGAVQSYRRMLLAQQIVANFDGVHSVINKLRV